MPLAAIAGAGRPTASDTGFEVAESGFCTVIEWLYSAEKYGFGSVNRSVVESTNRTGESSHGTVCNCTVVRFVKPVPRSVISVSSVPIATRDGSTAAPT